MASLIEVNDVSREGPKKRGKSTGVSQPETNMRLEGQGIREFQQVSLENMEHSGGES